MKHYTVGMAGHIDHGKTALTKALTGVDTDRLKAEKERGVSIEPGYARLDLDEEMQVSIIDVPGHERFIRQMIAGVAGIDLVVLVVAADEGVMPQTEEHLEILTYLGVENGIVVITKCEKADEEILELVKEDVRETLSDCSLAEAEIVCVDSLSGRGMATLKQLFRKKLPGVAPRKRQGPLRLPIDQVFTIHGQGTIVRGTIVEGTVKEGETLTVYPERQSVRVRQIQVQHERVKQAGAGQRAAINVSGLSKQELHRGDVLVGSDADWTTKRLDVKVTASRKLRHHVKQRAPIRLHIGTAQAKGKMVFFDRKQLEAGEEAYVQLQLEEPIVAVNGDRFIIRRPTPAETIGGGKVIEAKAEKHRFGEETIQRLKKRSEGTLEEAVLDRFEQEGALAEQQISDAFRVYGEPLKQLLATLHERGVIRLIGDGQWVYRRAFDEVQNDMIDQLKDYHERYPLRRGIEKAEMLNRLKGSETVKEAALEALVASERVNRHGPVLALAAFVPAMPKAFEKRLKRLTAEMEEAGLEVDHWQALVEMHGLPETVAADFRAFLLEQNKAVKLGDFALVHREAFRSAVRRLFEHTGGAPFDVKTAKAALDVSRKYLIPLLERMDAMQMTVRTGNERKWIDRGVRGWLKREN
ncbi:MAG TPA: selenocysteine-specific translation elongation factor [Bacillales bacterium]|nr:selenocysteine-specific translation elongation factor [Bacillales bacterium]